MFMILWSASCSNTSCYLVSTLHCNNIFSSNYWFTKSFFYMTPCFVTVTYISVYYSYSLWSFLCSITRLICVTRCGSICCANDYFFCCNRSCICCIVCVRLCTFCVFGATITVCVCIKCIGSHCNCARSSGCMCICTHYIVLCASISKHCIYISICVCSADMLWITNNRIAGKSNSFCDCACKCNHALISFKILDCFATLSNGLCITRIVVVSNCF